MGVTSNDEIALEMHLNQMGNMVTQRPGISLFKVQLDVLNSQGKPERRTDKSARGLNDVPVYLWKGERISFSHLLSPMMCHQWSVKGKMGRTTVNFLAKLKRLGKKQCEL